jgi:hypothetical protein
VGSNWSGRAAVVVGVSLALAGCTDSGNQSLPPASVTSAPTSTPTTASAPATTAPSSNAPSAAPTGGTTRSPIRWFVKPTGDPAKDAVQRTVQEYWSMFTRLAETPAADDPAIGELTVEPLLTRTSQTFAREAQQHRSQRGPLDGSVSAISVSGNQARATACLDLTKVQSYSSNGRPVPGTRGGVDLYVMSLRLVGGAWKVADYDSPAGSTCTVSR